MPKKTARVRPSRKQSPRKDQATIDPDEPFTLHPVGFKDALRKLIRTPRVPVDKRPKRDVK
jgi:hypothetical protein